MKIVTYHQCNFHHIDFYFERRKWEIFMIFSLIDIRTCFGGVKRTEWMKLNGIATDPNLVTLSHTHRHTKTALYYMSAYMVSIFWLEKKTNYNEILLCVFFSGLLVEYRVYFLFQLLISLFFFSKFVGSFTVFLGCTMYFLPCLNFNYWFRILCVCLCDCFKKSFWRF